MADAAASRLELSALTALGQHLEVDEALLAIDNMGVRVDQAGGQNLAGEIADDCRSRRPRGGANPGDPAVLDPDGTRLDEAERRAVGHGGHRGVGEQEIEHWRERYPQLQSPAQSVR